MDKKIMQNRYVALFLLHALGDLIGSKNMDWQEIHTKKFTEPLEVQELIFIFIKFGGMTGINTEDWKVSDDTFYHYAIGKNLLKFKENVDDDFLYDTKKRIMDVTNEMTTEFNAGTNRYQSSTIYKYVSIFSYKRDARLYPYDPMSGGNGCATRTLCIGASYYKEDQLDTLIELSIITSKITHNSPIGFLGGFTSAYFASLAMQKIPIKTWPTLLVSILNTEKIKKYIDVNNNDVFADYIAFIRFWRTYIDTRFVDGIPIRNRSTLNITFRIKYYIENFVKPDRATLLGSSGFCATIVAYDALLDCQGLWEKLIYYSMLIPGESDTMGAIAGGLYGLVYGMEGVPYHMLYYIEKRKMLTTLGKKFAKKFDDK